MMQGGKEAIAVMEGGKEPIAMMQGGKEAIAMMQGEKERVEKKIYMDQLIKLLPLQYVVFCQSFLLQSIVSGLLL